MRTKPIYNGDGIVVDMIDLLNLQAQLFLMMLAGFFFRKYILSKSFEKGLTDVIIDLILPCNIVASFQIELDSELIRSTLLVLAVAFAAQIISIGLGMVLFRRSEEADLPVLKYGTLCSNAGFLGTPVAEGIWGAEGILLASIFLVPQRILMWTVGLTFFHREKQNAFLTMIKNPTIDAVLVGLVLAVTQMPLPAFLNNTMHAFSNCNSGMSMFLIGMITSRIKPRDFLDKNVLYLSAVRLVLIPLIVLIGCRLFGVDELATGVAVILAAMPVAGTTAVLAAKYDCNAEFAASSVAASTALSLLVIPVWGLILS